MTYAVAIALLLLLGLLTLVSYVDRVYQEVGKFLSREFQDNIDVFEQKVEPELGVGRTRAALSMAVLDAAHHGGDCHAHRLYRLHAIRPGTSTRSCKPRSA